MSTLLKLPSRKVIPKRLVTDWFDPKQPYVFFLGMDQSRTMYNIEGWRANNLPKPTDNNLLMICERIGTPSGVSSEEVVLPTVAVELTVRERPNGMLYKHIEENGRILWLPRRPLNIKPDSI